MKFLKGLALGVLSFLLFILLTVFGLALTVRQTAMNPHFVNSVVNETDFSEVVREALTQQSNGGTPPSPELVNAIVSDINNAQPVIKQKLNIAVDDAYDYMLGKKSSPDLNGTLRATFCNSQFVAALLQNINLGQLADQLLTNQDKSSDAATQAFTNSMVATIKQMEPTLKQDVVAASDPIFKYILADANSLDLKGDLRTNVFNKEFFTQAINSLDITSTVRQTIGNQLNSALPQGITLSSADIDQIVQALQPTIKQGLIASADQIADYICGLRSDFNVNIPAASVMTTNIKPIVKQEFLQRLPSYLAGATQSQKDQAFETYWLTAQGYFPANYSINSSMFDAGFQSSISDGLTNAQQTLTDFRNNINDAQNKIAENTQQPREIIHIFQLAFIGLIVVLLLIIGGMILLHRSVRGASRDLGINFICYGALEFAMVIVLRLTVGSVNFIHNILPSNTPQAVMNLMHSVIQKATQPLFIFTLVTLILGIALLVLSFVYPRNQAKKQAQTPETKATGT